MDYFRGERVIVTGAGGFIGSRLVAALSAHGADVVRLPHDRLSRGGAWQRALPGARAVFHLAAQTSVSTAGRDVAKDFKANVQPMIRLLEACRARAQKPGIVFASTVTIAGIPGRLPVDETAPDAPMTIYDIHKRMAELYLEHFVRLGAARGTSLRLPNVYGPGPLSKNPDRGVLNAMIARAAAGEPVTVYGSGRALRDYLYIDDAVAALLAAARRLDALDGRHFVLGTGDGRSIAEAARLIARRASVGLKKISPPSGLGGLSERNFIADPGLFRKATGWRAEVSLARGIELTFLARQIETGDPGQRTTQGAPARRKR